MTYAANPCGFAAKCSRPLGHHGHHGGWRTGVVGTAPDPVLRAPQTLGHALGHELTARELQVIAATFVHGDQAAAAGCLGIAYQTVRNHLVTAMHRTGAVSTFQLAWLIGWMTLPAGVACHEAAA